MRITLPPYFVQFVNECVASGRYESADDVVHSALLLLKEQEEDEETRFAMLRAAVEVGVAAVERGDVISGDEAFARLRARRPARREA
jgi:antitoxin ParD1/3/4